MRKLLFFAVAIAVAMALEGGGNSVSGKLPPLPDKTYYLLGNERHNETKQPKAMLIPENSPCAGRGYLPLL